MWCDDEDCGSAYVQLDADWSRLLPALGKIGLLMACAPSHPVTAAEALKAARFEKVPESPDWICLESGMEICQAKLGGVLATLEPLEGGQQTAALQFFDRSGEGCLKLLVTNRSDLAAFEHLVSRHAMPPHISPFGQTGSAAALTLGAAEPDAQAVRSLWGGTAPYAADEHLPRSGRCLAAACVRLGRTAACVADPRDSRDAPHPRHVPGGCAAGHWCEK